MAKAKTKRAPDFEMSRDISVAGGEVYIETMEDTWNWMPTGDEGGIPGVALRIRAAYDVEKGEEGSTAALHLDDIERLLVVLVDAKRRLAARIRLANAAGQQRPRTRR